MTTQADLDLIGVEQCVNLLLIRSMEASLRVTALKDPDGYQLHFQSPTDAPEESEYED